jgi:hypothetical protein
MKDGKYILSNVKNPDKKIIIEPSKYIDLNVLFNKLKTYNKKLKEYRYCDDISDIQDGRFIRWISLKDPENVTLRNGAYVSEILILKNGLHVQCMNRGRVFQIKYDECEIFQKLTREEHILLSVLSNLEK